VSGQPDAPQKTRKIGRKEKWGGGGGREQYMEIKNKREQKMKQKGGSEGRKKGKINDEVKGNNWK
jgi:hypothetical protein